MAHSRRQKLARTLASSSDLTYQQALARLASYVATVGRLPRTDAELPTIADAAFSATSPASGRVEHLRRVTEVKQVKTFVMRSSNLARCPHLVMSVAHWLPTGECAHSEPECPTCAGLGMLEGADGPVTCGPGAGLPTGVPVCAGSGVWTGART